MIALTSCIGKAYHLILAKRFTTYLTENKFINPELQKAFLPGINGYIEHNIVMDEIIKTARTTKKTLHTTWFDLEDAFGSVPHSLIFNSLERVHIPEVIQKYLKSQYKNTKSVVVTNSFRTEPFSFKRGVFQGDPLSPIIFLLAFNPILESLEAEKKLGFQLDGKSFITLPYADDFCLITTNLKTHQRLMNKINNQIASMGMRLKPSKCRSFSLKSGKPTQVLFQLDGKNILTLFEDEQKYLGKLIFPLGKSDDTFQHLKSIFSEKLENIDSVKNRNEHKMWI